MTIENFYKALNSQAINSSAIAELLGMSHPTIRNRRKNQNFTQEELIKLKDAGFITGSDELIKDWGRHVMEVQLDKEAEKMGLDLTVGVIYDLEFERWLAVKKLNIHE